MTFLAAGPASERRRQVTRAVADLMKPGIVNDGESRLRSSLEFQARLRELRDSVRARHSAEMAEAGFFRRLVLRWRMAAEYRRERRKIEPSPRSLYSSHISERG